MFFESVCMSGIINAFHASNLECDCLPLIFSRFAFDTVELALLHFMRNKLANDQVCKPNQQQMRNNMMILYKYRRVLIDL